MFRRWSRLPAEERRLFLRALVLLAAARAALRLLPFRLLRSRFLRPVPSRRASTASPEAVDRAVARAARLLPGSTCLARSLAAARLLRAAGLPGEIRLGVARDRGGDLRAHAWVAAGSGTVPRTRPDAGYEPLGAL